MMGQLRLGDQPLNRSHNGRWYAHVNSYNEVSLIREDGRERRLLAELPSKLAENWLSYWSADDEWLYMVSGLQPQTYTEQSAFIRVYRMRIDEGIMELVTEFHNVSGRALHVSNDWLILLGIDDEGSARLYRMRSDGSEISDGVEIDVELLAYNYWIGSSGEIFAYKGGNYGGVPMYHINVERALVEPMVYGGDGSVLVDIGLPQVSSDGRYLAGSYTAPSERGFWNVADWVVLDDAGAVVLQVPIHLCGGLGVFWVDNLVYAGEAVDGECRRLLEYRPGDSEPRVAQEFPKHAVSVTLLPTEYPEWIGYILDDTWYISNWDGSETYPLKYSGEGSVQGWLTIPMPETDKRRGVVMGLGLIVFAVLTAHFKIVRR
jgi:hypothetical protein